MKINNKIVIDPTGKDVLGSFFATKKPGDTGSFEEVMWQIDSAEPTQVVMSITNLKLAQGTETDFLDTGTDEDGDERSPLETILGGSDNEEV